MTEPIRVTLWKPGDPPPSCQHHRIDNQTWKCQECGERMTYQTSRAETVVSAPSVAECQNPACLKAIADGTFAFDDDAAPEGCTNPHGMYVPDRSRERTVVLGFSMHYECERCRNDGTLIDHTGIVFDCGKHHEGDRVRVNDGQ